jgi:hypothetical protein
MMKNIKSKILHRFFDFQVRGALKLPTIDRKKDIVSGLCVLSMLCRRDFFQYLISIYSFTDKLNPEKIVVVNDGSLSERHLQILRRKIPDIEILHGPSYYDERLPTYTSWQRMLALVSKVDNYYVIQLDADIISVGDLSEVKEAIERNYSFILGTQDQFKTPISEAVETARNHPTGEYMHIQHRAELHMHCVERIGLSQYVRGCAGFAGYAKESFTINELVSISACMFETIAEHWREWGSEQVTANILIANQVNSIILPTDYYHSVLNFAERLKLVHFLGSWRFNNMLYNKMAMKYLERF